MFDQLKNIVAAEGIAAGQHQHWRSRKGGQLVKQSKRLLGRKLVGVRMRLGTGTAMLTDQPTGLRHFIKDEHWATMEVEVLKTVFATRF